MSLINKGDELFNKAKAQAGFQSQSTDDRILAELKKIAQASGKNSFTRPYRIAFEYQNNTGSGVLDPNYNITVPKFPYPVSFLKAMRTKWVQVQTGSAKNVIVHRARLYSFGSQSMFDDLEPTFGAPTPAGTISSVNTEFNFWTFQSNQSDSGWEMGFDVLLPDQPLGLFVDALMGGPYNLPNLATDYIIVDLWAEHSLTLQFKPS